MDWLAGWFVVWRCTAIVQPGACTGLVGSLAVSALRLHCMRHVLDQVVGWLVGYVMQLYRIGARRRMPNALTHVRGAVRWSGRDMLNHVAAR